MASKKQTYTYLVQLLEHKRLVGHYLQRFTSALFERAVVHDASKFGPEELEPYAKMLPRFAKAAYGSEEYIACCRGIKPALDHHLQNNTHHPEFYPGGINDMDLFDVVEMVCDWIAAAQRANGDTVRLDLQRTRFGIDDQLYKMICKTAETLTADMPDFHIVVV
jgi:hypothetical protein